MDAPQHSQARAVDLGQFRRWNRARSYTYGDSQGPTQVHQAVKPSGSADNNQFDRANVPLGVNSRPVSNTIDSSRRGQSFHGLHTLEEDYSALNEAERQVIEETIGTVQASDFDHDETAPSEADFTETEEADDAEVELQEASFGDVYGEDVDEPASSPSGVIEEQPPQTQPEEDEEDEEEDEDENFQSSPCVTAEMKRGKNRGKHFFQRTFKPLAFKPFGLSLVPPKPRDTTKAVSHAV